MDVSHRYEVYPGVGPYTVVNFTVSEAPIRQTLVKGCIALEREFEQRPSNLGDSVVIIGRDVDVPELIARGVLAFQDESRRKDIVGVVTSL